MTVKDTWVPNTEPPFTPDRYGELVFVVVERSWNNAINNVESDSKHYFPSDHFPVLARCKIKLERNRRGDGEPGNTWRGAHRGEEVSDEAWEEAMKGLADLAEEGGKDEYDPH